MPALKTLPWTFVDVEIFDENRIYIASINDSSINGESPPFTSVIRWIDSWAHIGFPKAASSICIIREPERCILAACADGTVWRWGTLKDSMEVIDKTKNGPGKFGAIREISSINNKAYIVGMGRFVYRCESPKKWIRIDDGVRADLKKEDDSGFNSISGFNDDDIYAAGFNGEIWHYDSKVWTKLNSPTNRILNKVFCAPDGFVYIVGQSGLLLKGNKNKFEIINQTQTQDQIYDACWFKDKLYVSTSNGLFTLENNDLIPVNIGKKIKPTSGICFYRLSSIDTCIWSVGEKMIIRSTDGIKWEELPYN